MKKAVSIFLALALVLGLSVSVLAATTVNGYTVDTYLAQGGTITLQSDVECYESTITEDTVIDLNGHTLSKDPNPSCPYVAYSNGNGRGALYVSPGATLTIQNGTIDELSLWVSTDGTLTLSNVTIQNTSIYNGGRIAKLENCIFIGHERISGNAIDDVVATVVYQDSASNSEYISNDNVSGKCEIYNVENMFSDIACNNYYFVPAYWALSNGVTTGKNSTTFAPLDSCTRGDVVTFLYRALVD